MGRLKIWAKKVEKAASRTLKAGLRTVLPKSTGPAKPIDPNRVHRILIVRQDSRLGNLLLMTPLLRGLHAAFPGADVDVLISDAYADAYRHNPFIDRIFILPKKIVLPNPARPWTLLRKLRRWKYDIAFDASHMHAFSLTSAVITSLVGAVHTVGYNRGDADRFLNHPIPSLPLPKHEMDILLNLARAAAPQARLPAAGTLKPEYFMTPDERAAGARQWSSWGCDEKTVAVLLGGRGAKRWPVEKFLELARALAEKGRRVVLFAGPAEKALLRKIKLPEGIIAAPALPLREFAAALSQARAAVSSDTGPMHLAAALDVPMVALFMDSDAWRFGYAHLPRQRVIDSPGRPPEVSAVLAKLSELLEDSSRLGRQ